MYGERFNPEAITVFTTNERVQLYEKVFGMGPDYRCDPRDCENLGLELVYIAMAGGELAIVDEDFFIDPELMRAGLMSYVDDERSWNRKLELAVVSSRRKANDPYLIRIAEYCHMYNVIFDCNYNVMVKRLEKLREQKFSRGDVIEMIRAGRNLQCDIENLVCPVGPDSFEFLVKPVQMQIVGKVELAPKVGNSC